MTVSRAWRLLLAAPLAGCAADPGVCAGFSPDPWDAAWEPDSRLEQASAIWETTYAGTADPDATCDGAPCLALTGPVAATAAFRANRGLEHTLVATLVNDVPVRVSVDQIGSDDLVRSLLEVTYEPGQHALDEVFTTRGNGDGDARLTFALDDAGTAAVSGLAVHGERWAPSAAAPASGVLQLGFLVHVEDDANFTTDEAIWLRRAAVLEGLSATLAAHGAKLNIQADASFLRGARVWEPDWVADRTAEGVGWSVHIHDESDPALVEPAIRDGRLAHREAGVTVSDLNGGFQTAPWSEAASAGMASLTAFKIPETQGGLPRVQVQPWRPADGVGADEPDAFLVHDPDGPLLYLPGHDIREVDHARFPESAANVVSQVRAKLREAYVNTWYFVLHVDGFGPSPDDGSAYDAYLADGFAADLAPYDAFLTALDPDVASGGVVYATPTELTEAWLAWNAACDPGD